MSSLSEIWGAREEEEMPRRYTLEQIRYINEWIDESGLDQHKVELKLSSSRVEYEQIRAENVGFFEQSQVMRDTLQMFLNTTMALKAGYSPTYNSAPEQRSARSNAGMAEQRRQGKCV